MQKHFLLACLIFLSTTAQAWWFNNDTSVIGNRHSQSFYAVKREMLEHIYYDHMRTLYCDAEFDVHKNIIRPHGFILPDLSRVNFKIYDITYDELKQKASRMEWEHIVPAENLGRNFTEWAKGHPNCHNGKNKNFKGRKCALQESEEYRYIYTDMYNLYPSIGAVNYLRANFNFTQFNSSEKIKNIFGSCQMKIAHNKAEPRDEIKGLIARTYLYMQKTYPRYHIGEPAYGIIKAWNNKYPVSRWECLRAYRIARLQGNDNMVVKPLCEAKGWYKEKL